jgi:hypothetical protein
MKIRATIYINKVVWEEVKEMAWGRRESASAFLEKLIKSGLKNFTSAPKAEKSEGFKTEIEKPIPEATPVENPPPVSNAKFQAEGQAKLDASRKERGTVKMEKIAKVRQKVESLTGFSGPLTKEQQARKKGK